MSLLLTPTDVSTLDDLPDGLIFQRATYDQIAAIGGLAEVATTGRYTDLIDIPELADVALSGQYGDLVNTPTISQLGESGIWGDIIDIPTGVTGSYNDLTDKPTLFSGAYTDLTGKPSLATVATSGSYTDLTGKPTIPAAQVQSDWNASVGLGVVLNKPSIPAAQVQSDWTASSGIGVILHKPSLATVATSGAYSDLSGVPVIDKIYEGTSLRSGAVGIFKSATVSSGVAVFNLTTDGTSTGAALFPNGVIADSISTIVNDATASYQMSWAFSNSNKTLTVTANKLSTANILTGVLGQAAANSAVVKLSIWGY